MVTKDRITEVAESLKMTERQIKQLIKLGILTDLNDKEVRLYSYRVEEGRKAKQEFYDEFGDWDY